jgi:molybdopterin synthase catalytic subunit
MGSPAAITVLAFGSAAELLGWTSRGFELPAGANLETLVTRLHREHPRLRDAGGRIRYAINQRYARPDSPLAHGDEVALIPPVAGG